MVYVVAEVREVAAREHPGAAASRPAPSPAASPACPAATDDDRGGQLEPVKRFPERVVSGDKEDPVPVRPGAAPGRPACPRESRVVMRAEPRRPRPQSVATERRVIVLRV